MEISSTKLYQNGFILLGGGKDAGENCAAAPVHYLPPGTVHFETAVNIEETPLIIGWKIA
jgi:hypothetical protein